MTPRPKSEEKKTKIIEAAINTFAKHGLEKGKISTIAKEAGIGKGTVYQYFNSKEEIFEQIILVVFDQLLEGWVQMINSDIPPKNKIELIIDYSIDMTIEMINSNNREQLTMIMEIFLYAFRNNDKVQIDLITQKIYGIIEPVIIEGLENDIFSNIDPKYFGFVFFSFLDGFALHLFFQHKHYDHKILADTIKKMILSGILKKEN